MLVEISGRIGGSITTLQVNSRHDQDQIVTQFVSFIGHLNETDQVHREMEMARREKWHEEWLQRQREEALAAPEEPDIAT
jgi:hypothetical protein